MKESMQKISITGIIMPNNWTENGEIIEIALYTNKEEVYLFERCSLADELINLMHKRVEITGRVRESQDGNKIIATKNFILLEKIEGRNNRD